MSLRSVSLICALSIVTITGCATDDTTGDDTDGKADRSCLRAAMFTLEPLDLAADPAVAAALAAYPNFGGNHAEVRALTAFSTPPCAPAPRLRGVVEAALAASMDPQALEHYPYASGQVVYRSKIEALPTFKEYYSPGAPALWEAIDAAAGGSSVRGWSWTEEESCNNCHQFGTLLVLWYPHDHKVVVLSAVHGYDS